MEEYLSYVVRPPPPELVERFDLDTRYYTKWADANGYPILASEKVPDEALAIVRDQVMYMLGNRPDVRQANRRSELDLTRWAEPWAALAWTLGAEYPAFYLDRAWRLLLANQAHDSLNGGAMDRIYHETAVRNE